MTLQVFEHQKIRIGKHLSQAQWQALVTFAERQGEKYFKILHNGIQFTQYVGVLQVGDLTIEILPKIDEVGDTNVQKVLIDMLRECRLVRPESASTAGLQIKNGSLFEIYIMQFLNEVEQLLHEGLTRTYSSNIQNRKVFKGKLLIHKQIEKNLLRKERFFTETLEYDYEHSYNQLLHSALSVLNKMPLKVQLAEKLQQLRLQFPVLKVWNSALLDFNNLRFDRKTLRYKTALRTALLILQQAQPDVRAGRLPVLAILFDMNFLFEAFIFRQLQKAAPENMTVRRQVPKPFWNRRAVQPDIVLTIDNQNIVMDTKWKKLQKVSPTMEDLRQMFVYNQYFNATRSVLVYPQVGNLKDLSPVPFQPVNDKQYFCEVRFVELVRENKLNRKLGNSLLDKILQRDEIA